MPEAYKITFHANLSEDDIRAMNKCFFDAMNESMEITELWDLQIQKD